MKKIIAVLLIGAASHIANGEDLIFETKTGETLILEKSIQWISEKNDFLEIGTNFGVFQIKGGKGFNLFWPFLSIAPSNKTPQKIFYETVKYRKKLSKNETNPNEQKFFEELVKIQKKDPAYSQYDQKILASLVEMYVTAGCSYYDFSCDSIEFRPHDH